MTALELDDVGASYADPLSVLEYCCSERDWAYERDNNDELIVAAPGSWNAYQLRAFWHRDDQVVQLACMLDIRVPDAKRAAIYETLGLINERPWLGHFEMWAQDGSILFRHAIVMDDDDESSLSSSQAHTLLESIVAECERYYPVFQFVLWAGKRPAEAMEAALLDPQGEA
ncbi:MAG TPA: YbjN domain-containing protein [Pedomonas sp.]|nr:YbjN domain-containing protein [Pedomonas sp.]